MAFDSENKARLDSGRGITNSTPPAQVQKKGEVDIQLDYLQDRITLVGNLVDEYVNRTARVLSEIRSEEKADSINTKEDLSNASKMVRDLRLLSNLVDRSAYILENAISRLEI